MAISTLEDVHQVIAEYDRNHPPESWYDKRMREALEAREAEERGRQARNVQQRQAVNNRVALDSYVDGRVDGRIDQRVEQQVMQWLARKPNPLIDAIGQVLAIRCLEDRKVFKHALEEKERALAVKLEALEQRIAQCSGRAETLSKARAETLGQAIGTERTERHKEVKAAVEEAQRAFETKLAALEDRIVQYTDQRIIQYSEQCSGRADALGEVIATERADRRKELEAAVEEAQHAFEAKLAGLEQRIVQRTDQQIIQSVEQSSERTRGLSNAIATEHRDRQKGVKAAVEEAQRAIDLKLEALEQRLKAVPGKLPVAKTWHPESVAYQSEFVSHEGALYQAKKDTAQTPGGADWVCVARSGRDAITPNVRGTFSVEETYKQLDIVVCDDGAFIAKHDNPGICSGDGWQLLSRQDRPGRKGETGERGMRGERGEKGETGPSIVSWQIDRERYRASPLMSDGTVGAMLELRGLFERFLSETSS